MNHRYLIRNQWGHWWGRGKRWVDGRDLARVAHWQHHDEVANTLFELSSQDFELRGEIVEVELVEGQLPKLEVSTVPVPGEDDEAELPLEIAVSDPTDSPDTANVVES